MSRHGPTREMKERLAVVASWARKEPKLSVHAMRMKYFETYKKTLSFYYARAIKQAVMEGKDTIDFSDPNLLRKERPRRDRTPKHEAFVVMYENGRGVNIRKALTIESAINSANEFLNSGAHPHEILIYKKVELNCSIKVKRDAE